MPAINVKFDNPLNFHIQNFYLKDGWVFKIPGMNKYNSSALPAAPVWGYRYYGIKPDKSFIKRLFAYSNGAIWMGKDSNGTFKSVKNSLKKDCLPEECVMQVAGNSRLYLFNGYDYPQYYEGDDEGTWYKSGIEYKFVQGIIKDDRLWGFESNSSTLYFSRSLYPEQFDTNYGGAIIVGNEKDSFIRRVVMLGDDLFVFKNDSIWVLGGSTKATYEVRQVIPNMGLLAQRAIAPVGSAIVFVCQQDKEVYEFNGTSIPKLLSKKITNNKLRQTLNQLIDINQTDKICAIWDRKNRLFRLSYNEKDAKEGYQNNEIIFSTDEMGENGMPKWSETYGAAISCYCLMDRQGDDELITGRSDAGYLMYHNRGSNWDTNNMTCILRTLDFTPVPGSNCDFNSVFIRGTPSTGTFTLKTFLNRRHTHYTEQNLDDTGERDELGAITLPTQYAFNTWIPILTGYNHGESIALEIFDNTNNKDIQLEEIVIDYTVREPIQNKLVGG